MPSQKITLFCRSSLIVFLLVCACGPKGVSGTNTNSGMLNSHFFLKESDFAESADYPQQEASQSAVSGDVDGLGSSIRNHTPDPVSAVGTSCLESVFNGENRFKVIENAILLEGLVENRTCAPSDTDKKLGMKETQIKRFQYLKGVSCELSAEVKAFDGKSVNELGASANKNPCLNSDSAAKIEQGYLEVTYGSSSESGALPTGKLKVVSTESSADLKWCVITSGTKDGCIAQELLQSEATTGATIKKQSTSSKLTFHNAKSSTFDQQYYESGSADLLVQGWTGLLTFIGKDAAPKWTLNKGGVTATGTLTERKKVLTSLADLPQNLERALTQFNNLLLLNP